MSDDDSFDELLPWQSRQRQIGPDFSADSDDEPDGREYESDDCFSTASDRSLLQDPADDEFGHATGEEDTVCADTEPQENHPDDGESAPIVAPELPTLERTDLGLVSAPRNGTKKWRFAFYPLSWNMEVIAADHSKSQGISYVLG